MTPDEAAALIATKATGKCRYTKEEQKANFTALRGKECKDCKHPPQPSRKKKRGRISIQMQPAYVPSPVIEYPASTGGAGTELKLLLKRFRIVAQPNCKCGQRAREMDANGIPWCEEHLGEIADWLEEEAKRRHLPFVRLAAVVLIRRAISNAKRKAKAMKPDDPIHRLADSVEMSPAPEAFQ